MNLWMKQLTIGLLIFSTLCLPQTASAMVLKKGTRGEDVKKVQLELKKQGFFNYPTATGYFGTITEQAVREFQKNNNLVVDGIIGKNTYAVLLPASTSTSTTKKTVNNTTNGMFDWWSKAQYIFPREKTATVKDVKTGKTFKIKRTFGTNHADVEPLTKQDTATIKEIWGGFSWERRAVVVIVDNTPIAGSMTAMPHAGLDNAPSVKVVNNRSYGYGRGQNLDAVKNNGMDGHLDIHFLNSRTHGSNVMQKSHQDKVKESGKYIKKYY